MKIVYDGEGSPAWFEPQTSQDEALIELARKDGWTIWQIIDKAIITE